MSDGCGGAVPLAPRQIARLIGDRGRGSRLIPLCFTPVTPFLDPHHKMWLGQVRPDGGAGGERGAQQAAGSQRRERTGKVDASASKEVGEEGAKPQEDKGHTNECGLGPGADVKTAAGGVRNIAVDENARQRGSVPRRRSRADAPSKPSGTLRLGSTRNSCAAVAQAAVSRTARTLGSPAPANR